MDNYLDWIEVYKESQELGFNSFSFLFYWEFHLFVVFLFFLVVYLIFKSFKKQKMFLSFFICFFLIFSFLYYNKEKYLVNQLVKYNYILPDKYFNETNLLSKISLNHSKGLKLIAKQGSLYFYLEESNKKRLKETTDKWEEYPNSIFKVPISALH